MRITASTGICLNAISTMFSEPLGYIAFLDQATSGFLDRHADWALLFVVPTMRLTLVVPPSSVTKWWVRLPRGLDDNALLGRLGGIVRYSLLVISGRSQFDPAFGGKQLDSRAQWVAGVWCTDLPPSVS